MTCPAKLWWKIQIVGKFTSVIAIELTPARLMSADIIGESTVPIFLTAAR
tara:strand:- start:1222 stop:1371 length:150 start_codon:yes stop_codon:yes gene_type:complete